MKKGNVQVKIRIKTVLSILILVVTMTVIIIASLGMYEIMNRSIRNNARENTQMIVEQINYDLEAYIKNVDTIITGLKYSPMVNDFFELQNNINNKEIEVLLDSTIKNREDVINIFLIREDGSIISNSGSLEYKKSDYTKYDYYLKAIESKKIYVSTSHVQNVFKGVHPWVVSCSQVIKSDDGAIRGIIVVDLNFENINDLVKHLSFVGSGYIFIVDDDYRYVYHPILNLMYSGLFEEGIENIRSNKNSIVDFIENGKKGEYIIVESDFTSWKIIGKVYANDFNIYLNTAKKYYLAILFIAFIFTSISALLISKKIVNPINRLVEGMLSFKSGDLDAKVEVIEENEFGLLTDIFNSMTEEIKGLIEKNKNVERNKRKSDFKLLQSQINPHFLYNTLDSIVWMGESGKNEEVVTMTSSLAKMFRLGLNKGEEYVSLEKEIEHINSYLTIQKMRYGEKLNYSIDYDKEFLNTKIIKILLQPIVENSIYHGIKNIPESGVIDIKIYKDKFNKLLLTKNRKDINVIYLEVEGNGPGISEEDIKSILAGKIKPAKKSSGIGLRNVNERIKMYYGDDYGIYIKSEMYEGTTVILKIPFEREENEEN